MENQSHTRTRNTMRQLYRRIPRSGQPGTSPPQAWRKTSIRNPRRVSYRLFVEGPYNDQQKDHRAKSSATIETGPYNLNLLANEHSNGMTHPFSYRKCIFNPGPLYKIAAKNSFTGVYFWSYISMAKFVLTIVSFGANNFEQKVFRNLESFRNAIAFRPYMMMHRRSMGWEYLPTFPFSSNVGK